MADTHRRQQIRDAVVADLQGLPTTGDRVYSGRRFRVHDLMLPGLLVYFDVEASEPLDMAGAGARQTDRQGELVVQGIVRAEPQLGDTPGPEVAVDDELDQISLEVERRLYAAAAGTLPGGAALEPLVSDWVLLRTELQASAEGRTIYGQVALAFQATYYLREDDPV